MRVLLPLRNAPARDEEEKEEEVGEQDDSLLVFVDEEEGNRNDYHVDRSGEKEEIINRGKTPLLEELETESTLLSTNKVEQALLWEKVGVDDEGGPEPLRPAATRIEKKSPGSESIARSVEGPHTQHPFLESEGSIQQKSNSASSIAKRTAALKTTGLFTPDASSSGSHLTSSSPSARKRRAATCLDEGARVDRNEFDRKPTARKNPKRNLETDLARATAATQRFTHIHSSNMVSSGGSTRGSKSNHWRYYHHPGDDVRQEPDDPAEESEVGSFRFENDPASARGDSLASTLTSVASRSFPAASSTPRNGVAGLHGPRPQIRTASIAAAKSTADTASCPNDSDFAAALKKRGLEIQEQAGDGNCLFRAISLQVYGDPAMHEDVRKQCMDFMERDQEHFSQFVTGEPFSEYVARKRQDGVHGNNPEIQAISELFNRPVEVFTPETGASPLNIFHEEYKTDDAPIRLSYRDGNHYDAIVDPLVPTAGLGLGLPGLQPGLADKMQMAKAVAESDAAADQMELERVLKDSEEDELQRAIKESKLSAEHWNSNNALSMSDLDATYFELEQAALERSLESLGQNEQGKKKRASTCTSKRIKQDDAGPIRPVSETADVPPQNVASLPCPSRDSIPGAASIPAAGASPRHDPPLRSVEEYPNSVQELVMNGFAASDVIKAYDLVGDNFDDMLSLLLSSS